MSQYICTPWELSRAEKQSLYSQVARNFLEGNALPHYVMIVEAPEPRVELDKEWQTIFVMLLSLEIEYLSQVDLLIPTWISGVEQNLLAQTWNVLPMLSCNLSHLVGQRLPRRVYDMLLAVGCYYHGQTQQSPRIQDIHSLGLRVGTVPTRAHSKIQAFHQQESAWADVLTVPVAAYQTYLKALKFTEKILSNPEQNT
ncbi:MAG: hypothetical protein JOZ78_24985 [Chroococcidiopsidaceae cyanobacterium CP_BM_ER_R8_30]|nr:hypothetical protein [Chroococcidiopsidaceae cyanobacterium CP_BM_ER_R8_30]